jgi:predicted secreted hydrolase
MSSKYRKIGLMFLVILLSGMLAACGSNTKETFPTPAANPNAGVIPVTTPGPVPGTKLNFPADQAPHDFLSEWWYYTGHVNTVDGNRYGIQFVIFQGIRADFPVAYPSHFAIVDANTKTFKYDQKIVTRDRSQIKFGGTDGFDLKVDNWTLRGKDGTDKINAKMTDGSYGIDLMVKDVKGISAHGGGQFSYGPSGSSYYYSRTRMAVSGSISVGNEVKTVKDGAIWFDQQWGNFIPATTKWDWFSIQLDDQSELMLYYLRDSDNNLLQTFGTYIPPCEGNCTPNQLIKSYDINQADFTIKPTEYWRSPKTNANYPTGWEIEIKGSANIPAMSLIQKAVVPGAELITTATTGLSYWEGDMYVSGTKGGKPISGSGYTELTGYSLSATR